MATNKSFHLRWNNHLSNLRTLLEYLYNEQSFVDVTLSCSDGLIRAHKLVLSACSPYFDTIFRENPCKHPTVILRGISLQEMQLIIEYMYVGSVDIPENELSGLLEIANELHIKGLVQDPGDEQERLSNKFDSPAHSPNNRSEAQTKPRELSVLDHSDSNKIFENIRQPGEGKVGDESSELNAINTESVPSVINMTQVKMEDCESTLEEEKMDSNKYKLAYNRESSDVFRDLVCNICNRAFLNKQNMKRHMQIHSGEKPHGCTFCDRSFQRLSHLQRHHRVHTGERPFLCDQCDKQFSRSDKLKQHIAQHHSGVIIPKQPKQRGRPRKIPMKLQIRPSLTVSKSHHKLTNEGLTNIANVHSFPTLQQLYSIQTNMPGLSLVQ